MTRFVAKKARLRTGRRRSDHVQGFQEEGQARFETVMEAAQRSGLLRKRAAASRAG